MDILKKQKKIVGRFVIRTTLICAILLLSCAAMAQAQQVVTLHKMQCSQADAAAKNTEFLSRFIQSDTTVILPAGSFSLNPITIDGVSNFTLEGTLEEGGTTSLTTVSFTDSGNGISLVNVEDISIQDINAEGPADSGIIVMQTPGVLQMTNYTSTAGNGQVYGECFTDFAWLIPILNIILD